MSEPSEQRSSHRGSHQEQPQGSRHTRKDPRQVNAWVAVGISVLFFVHACFGCVFLIVAEFPTNLAWVIWIGVCAICAHIILSGATTWTMFTDETRPPSARKRGHQIKKWVTGGLLFLVVAAHAIPASMGVSVPQTCATALLAAAAIALCVHVCTGIKSLTRDLQIDACIRTPIRACAIVLCIAIIGALIVIQLIA